MGKRITEEKLGEKMDNQGRPVTFIAGSLRFVDDEHVEADPQLAHLKGKQVVDRECNATGAVYAVATSDLHQSFYAPAERPNQRKLKAQARRAAKKAEAEAKAEVVAEQA